ncbi:MAG: hypothetical protein ACTMUB_01895 [cyanobacterium endosymbiont of Rhopalodia musculus]
MMNCHLGIIDDEIGRQLTISVPEQNFLDKIFVSYDTGCGTGVKTE